MLEVQSQRQTLYLEMDGPDPDNVRMGTCPQVVFPLTTTTVGLFHEGHEWAGRLPMVDKFRRVSGLVQGCEEAEYHA